MSGRRTHKRQVGQSVARGSRASRLLCTLAASFAAIALLVPAVATATSKSKLISEAKQSMRIETKNEEKQHLVPFKTSAVFALSCKVNGDRVLCSEHSGSQKCVSGSKPATELSDIFPVIKGRVGLSLDFGLTVSSVYCKKTPAKHPKK
jgi:hypothetical protein